MRDKEKEMRVKRFTTQEEFTEKMRKLGYEWSESSWEPGAFKYKGYLSSSLMEADLDARASSYNRLAESSKTAGLKMGFVISAVILTMAAFLHAGHIGWAAAAFLVYLALGKGLYEG